MLGHEREELNLGYERIPLHVVKAALERASAAQGARIHNFFVCPTATSNVKPAHEWHIEFSERPRDLGEFTATLDRALHDGHELYSFARRDDHLLSTPSLVAMAPGTIERFELATREFGLGKFLPIYTRETLPPRC